MRKQFLASVAVAGLAVAGACFAQQPPPLTLPQAVAVALERDPGRKAALAESKAASASVRMARSAFLPRLDFSETVTRSNDPVYVFGTRLQQSRFTSADFALNRLNQPTPIGNFATRFGAQWNVFDSLASTRNLRRARHMNEAAGYRLAMEDQQLVFRVVQAYYQLVLAGRQLEVAEQAHKTAEAAADESRAKTEAGTAVESDYLAAQVHVASRQQELVRARNNAALTLARLNLAIGLPADSPHAMPTDLKEGSFTAMKLEEAERQALQQRPDLKQAASEVAAQESGVQAAKSALGPRLDIFAASELDNVSLFGNGGNHWLAGAGLQIDLFSGGSKLAQVSREKAMLERATANRQMAEDQVRLEVRRAFYEWDSARQMIEVARSAVARADEGLRIVRNRYDAGLTTMTDLLRAEDAARAAGMNYWEAIYHYQVGYAALELATGNLSPKSDVVTQSSGVGQ